MTTRQAVILAGGRGTRLRAAIGDTSKALAKIGTLPVLGHQLSLCHQYGFDDVILLLGFAAEDVRAYVGDGAAFGVAVRCITEKEPLGTAGAVFAVQALLADTFLVMYVDTMLDVDLGRMWDFHHKKKPAVTVLAHPNDHPFDSDLIRADAEDRVQAFYRLPRGSQPAVANLASAALYLMERGALTVVAGKDNILDFGRDVFPSLIGQGVPISAYRTVEYIKDIGTPERLAEVNHDYAIGRVDPLRSSRLRPVIFLDRDGTINLEKGGIRRPEDMELLPGTAEAIRHFNRAGLATVVVTNQPFIAHGSLSEETLGQVHAVLDSDLARQGAFLNAIYYCPHHPDAGYEGERHDLKIKCDCRKPEPGLIWRAVRDYHLDLSSSWMIGDHSMDVELARRCGIRSVLLRSGHGGRDGKYSSEPDYVFDDLLASSKFIVDAYPVMRRTAESIVAGISPGMEILIGGLARSGKSVWASVIGDALRERNLSVFRVSLDDWLLDEHARGSEVTQRYDLAAVVCLLSSLRDRTSVTRVPIPIYDRHLRKRVGERMAEFVPGSVILIEGVVALTLPSVDALRLAVRVSDATRYARFQSFYRCRDWDDEKIESLWVEREQEETPAVKASYAKAIILDSREQGDR